MGLFTDNLSIDEEGEWENILSKLLHCSDDKHKFVMSLGFGWEKVMSLRLNASPSENAREVITVLIDNLTLTSRELLLSRVESRSLPEWITGVTKWC